MNWTDAGNQAICKKKGSYVEIAPFPDVTPCCPVEMIKIQRILLPCTETWVQFWESTRRHISVRNNFRSHRREHLVSHD